MVDPDAASGHGRGRGGGPGGLASCRKSRGGEEWDMITPVGDKS